MSKSAGKSYSSGYSVGRKNFCKAVRQDGEIGIAKCDKAANTCLRYANDNKLTVTKKGKPLTPELRSFYKGMADGFLKGYNDLPHSKQPIYDSSDDFDFDDCGHIKGHYQNGRFEPN